MQLLDQIIEAGTSNVPPPLTTVLRQCIVLANELKTPLLRTWAEQELKGYPNPKEVPDYRVMNVGAYGNFAGIGGIRYQARPIPAGMLKPEHRWAATVYRLTEPVSAYESLGDSKGALIYDWHSDMIALYQSSLLQGCVLMTAWQQVPKTAIAGVLDTIRTRVLTTAIDGIGDGELAELSQAIEKDGRKFGSGVKGWISRNPGKVFDQGLQATVSVGTTILTAKIKQSLGLP
jgi:hypothetical protein